MERPWYRSLNWALAATCVVIACLGDVMIHSANLRDPGAAGEWRKQILYIVIGVFVMGACAATDYNRWRQWARVLYAVNFLLLAFVFHSGHSAYGAVRWISLGPLGTFQPSEPAKPILAVVIAAMLSRRGTLELRDILETIGVVAIPALLILKQPDLGTTLVILAIFSVELFFGAAKTRYFAVYAAGVALLGAFVVGTNLILRPFQRSRLLVFLHPDVDPQGVGWNLSHSKIAVGSGELFGKGLYHGTQTQLNFVPEHSRDFIFTVLGEEFGFIGSAALLAMYAVVLFGGIIAMLTARDRFGFLLAAGLAAMTAFHVVVNIGMTIGIMPITGIPLPFMSYGGSAIITDFMAVGILLNIHMQRDKLVF
jgi:rod shape determining protein RodA